MNIKSIEYYRDGGTVSILITNIDPNFLERLSVSNIPKYSKGSGGYNDVYEIWRCFEIGSENKGKYYWGNINGDHIEINEFHPLLKQVKDLLLDYKDRMNYKLDKFIDKVVP